MPPTRRTRLGREPPRHVSPGAEPLKSHTRKFMDSLMFSSLLPLLQGVDLTLHLHLESAEDPSPLIRVTVIPVHGDGSRDPSLFTPLNLLGTAAELDSKFTELVSGYTEVRQTLEEQLAATLAEMKERTEAASKKAAEKSKLPGKAVAPVKGPTAQDAAGSKPIPADKSEEKSKAETKTSATIEAGPGAAPSSDTESAAETLAAQATGGTNLTPRSEKAVQGTVSKRGRPRKTKVGTAGPAATAPEQAVTAEAELPAVAQEPSAVPSPRLAEEVSAAASPTITTAGSSGTAEDTGAASGKKQRKNRTPAHAAISTAVPVASSVPKVEGDEGAAPSSSPPLPAPSQDALSDEAASVELVVNPLTNGVDHSVSYGRFTNPEFFMSYKLPELRALIGNLLPDEADKARQIRTIARALAGAFRKLDQRDPGLPGPTATALRDWAEKADDRNEKVL